MTDLRAALDRAERERGFSDPFADDPFRDFMATYFDNDDDTTRSQVLDFIDRIFAALAPTPEPSAEADALREAARSIVYGPDRPRSVVVIRQRLRDALGAER